MLSREFLLSRGSCCGNGCANCPYLPKWEKGSTNIEKGCIMLPVVKMETLSGALDVYKMSPDTTRLYAEMFEQQPVFEHLVQMLFDTGWSHEMIDGYCRGLFQAWHLLNTQAFVEDMNDQN